VPVIANVSSLPEAGENLAVLFENGNHNDLADVCKELINNSDYRDLLESRIREKRNSMSWQNFAEVITNEIVEARNCPAPSNFNSLEFDREYGLIEMGNLDVDHSGKNYLKALDIRRKLPLTGQIATIHHHTQALLTIDGDLECSTRMGMKLRSKNHGSTLNLFLRQGAASLLIISVYCRKASSLKFDSNVEVLSTSKHGVMLLATVAPNVNEKIEITFRSTFRKKVYATSFLVLDSDDAEIERKLNEFTIHFLDNDALFLHRNDAVSPSDFLMKIISWKIPKLIRKTQLHFQKLLKK
jgi:hypothetical protein